VQVNPVVSKFKLVFEERHDGWTHTRSKKILALKVKYNNGTGSKLIEIIGCCHSWAIAHRGGFEIRHWGAVGY
jgi:hypothetical protein